MSIVCVVLAYLIGSISNAVIVSKLYNIEDPRTAGSKNAGATNMLRLAGKGLASTVLIADIAKGVITVLLAKFLGVTGTALGFVALAVVIGHILPIFAQFQGGKGIATSIGCCYGLDFMFGVMITIIWITVVTYYRYSSLGGIIACVFMPILGMIFHAYYFIPLAIMCGVIIIAHRENIARLLAGTEPKINLKANAPEP